MNAVLLKFLKNFLDLNSSISTTLSNLIENYDSTMKRYNVDSLDAVHNAIHKGHYFNITTVITGLNNGVNTDYYFANGTEQQIHFFINSGFLDIGDIYLYENPTVTAATGSPVTPINRNRMGTPHTFTGDILLNPTVTGVGTLLNIIRTGSTTQRAWMTRSEGEFVLDSTKTYLLRHTSLAASNILQVMINFYEKDFYYE